MISYKTYNFVAAVCLIAVSGFTSILIFGSDPQDANAVSTEGPALGAPTVTPILTDNLAVSPVEYSEVQGELPEMIPFEGMEPLVQDLPEGATPIEITSDDSGNSAHFASAVEVDDRSNLGVNASNYSGYSSSSASSSSGSSSSSYGGSGSTGSSGMGSSGGISGSGSGGGASNGSGTGTGTGTGGSGTNNGGSIFPDSDPSDDSSGDDDSGSNGTGGGSTQADAVFPEWIEKEGIRGAFISSTAGNLAKIPRYIEAMKTMGLNTAIVYGCSFAESPNHLNFYRQWIRQCNQANLNVFAYYAWQPPVGNSCHPVVFSDGTDGLFPCPLDTQLWQRYFEEDIANKLAREAVVGIFLDMEMYRTEGEPNTRKHYSFDTCFCDSCFSRYILNRTQIQPVPSVGKGQRKSWLLQNGFLPDYYAYLIEQVELKAEHLKAAARTLNPNLVFGVYPALTNTNWVRSAVMRAFGRNSYPVISFTTDTYGYLANPWGADRIPSDLTAYFDNYTINGIYAAGYLLRKYTSADIGTQIIHSHQRSQGYWLFQLSQLIEDPVSEDDQLAGGTRADYIQTIRAANASLQGDE